MTGGAMRFVSVLVVVLGVACSGRKSERPSRAAVTQTPSAETQPASKPAATGEMIRASEQAATDRAAQRTCGERVTVYEGSIDVAASTYVQGVARGDAWVDEPIADLDRVLSTAPRIDFTLDYPFEKPFNASITGDITLRRIIDAVRGGFRHMYEGATVRDIPKMGNKDVNGPYGRAFHAIDDLVIESIDLCDGRRLEVSIGS